MKTMKLGKTGIDISRIGLGTWSIGGGSAWGGDHDLQTVVDTIREAPKCGVNLIDTAPGYNFGNSEKILGKALEGIRDKVLIATKFGLRTLSDGSCEFDGTRENVLKELEISLNSLRTDYIDFYIMHWPDPNTPIHEAMETLAKLKEAGIIRFIGVSNFTKEQIIEAQKYVQIDVHQPPYSMLNESQKDLMIWAEMEPCQ
mgnify:CR=1 FL=1